MGWRPCFFLSLKGRGSHLFFTPKLFLLRVFPLALIFNSLSVSSCARLFRLSPVGRRPTRLSSPLGEFPSALSRRPRAGFLEPHLLHVWCSADSVTGCACARGDQWCGGLVFSGLCLRARHCLQCSADPPWPGDWTSAVVVSLLLASWLWCASQPALWHCISESNSQLTSA